MHIAATLASDLRDELHLLQALGEEWSGQQEAFKSKTTFQQASLEVVSPLYSSHATPLSSTIDFQNHHFLVVNGRGLTGALWAQCGSYPPPNYPPDHNFYQVKFSGSQRP